MTQDKPCPDCDGSGLSWANLIGYIGDVMPCERCWGEGTVEVIWGNPQSGIEEE